MVGPYNVPARTLTAPPGGLLTVADVVDVPTNRILGGVKGDPGVCVLPRYIAGGDCVPGEDPATKDFDGLGVDAEGVPFVVYLGIECYLNGGTMEAEARDAFEIGESRTVGQAFYDLLLVPNSLGLPDAATHAGALATAQQALRDIPGQGVIHMTAADAILLGSHIRYDSDFNLFTRLGTPINADLPDDALGTIYATGPVTLYRGSEVEVGVSVLTLNQSQALIERPWAVHGECMVYSIEITETP